MMTPRFTSVSFALACFSMVLVGCGDNADGPGKGAGAATDPGTLPTNTDTTYVVTSVTDKGVARPIVKGSEIRLRLVDGRLVVTAGCNTMSGDYKLDGTRMTVAAMGATMMGCEPALMDQDAWIGKLFEAPVQFNTGKDAAVISGDVVLALADRKTVSPDKPLVGTKWILDGLVSADSVSSVPSGATATLEIDDKGVAFVHDSCNGGSGPATVAGDKITWGERSLTRMACRDKDQQEVQDAVAKVLSGATTFKIEEKSLTVTQGDRALTFRAAGK